MNHELLQSPNRPFRATPDARFYFAHDSIETARQTVLRAVLRAEGPVMVLGGAGLGKSLLGEVIAADLEQRLDVVRLHAARLCSRRALLQNILFELQLPYRDLSEGELRLSILDRLEPSPETAPDGVLLLVDEAHTLPMKLLDELRLINNFNRNNQPRTRLVLIGNLRLEDTFTSPQMDSFNQRLAARCYLQPMNREDTFAFIRHQLKVSGLEPNDTITRDGLEAAYAASEGVPRLVNQVMDHALVLAVANSQNPISAPLVEEAWADLQQLPAPWHGEGDSLPDHSSAVVEFGSLDEVDIQSVGMESQTSDTILLAEEPTLLSESSENTDVPLDVPAEPIQNNYFAAFSPAADGGADDFVITPEANSWSDRATNEDSSESVSESVAAQPESLNFAEKDSAEIKTQPQQYEAVTIDATERSSAVSFFADKPTDEELIAFEDEQSQYDAMGVWENDPPLAQLSINTWSSTENTPIGTSPEQSTSDVVHKTEPQVADKDLGAVANISPSNELFGNDFDEEFAVPSSREVGGTLESHSANTVKPNLESLEFQSDTLAQQAAVDAADYVAKIQEFADTIAKTHAKSPRVEDIVGEMVAEQIADGDAKWQVLADRADMESEIAIAQDIEDIVSQLNFSAFTVEPFSVEQIALDAPRKPAIPKDSIRSGEREEIYMLHKAQLAESQSFFSDASAEYDDDRDLLIIEEELPVSAKATDQTQEQTKPKKTTQYSQLFAKLRK